MSTRKKDFFPLILVLMFVHFGFPCAYGLYLSNSFCLQCVIHDHMKCILVLVKHSALAVGLKQSSENYIGVFKPVKLKLTDIASPNSHLFLFFSCKNSQFVQQI